MTKLSDISKGQNCINREKRYGPQKQRYKEGLRAAATTYDQRIIWLSIADADWVSIAHVGSLSSTQNRFTNKNLARLSSRTSL
ncbi:hypothetical protein WN944_006686 [Citrus x changshan-huyou]|uniref:Uncharacterized protein n=1 Tax=Citrus x changshan-huyou TaxID=2935761 RepID=A0AAP0MM97_9ROSI